MEWMANVIGLVFTLALLFLVYCGYRVIMLLRDLREGQTALIHATAELTQSLDIPLGQTDISKLEAQMSILNETLSAYLAYQREEEDLFHDKVLGIFAGQLRDNPRFQQGVATQVAQAITGEMEAIR